MGKNRKIMEKQEKLEHWKQNTYKLAVLNLLMRSLNLGFDAQIRLEYLRADPVTLSRRLKQNFCIKVGSDDIFPLN